MTGRFISQDPARHGLNWYTYCGNNPILMVDPSGLSECIEMRPLRQWFDEALKKLNASGRIDYDAKLRKATVYMKSEYGSADAEFTHGVKGTYIGKY